MSTDPATFLRAPGQPQADALERINRASDFIAAPEIREALEEAISHESRLRRPRPKVLRALRAKLNQLQP